jgi:hypothetical protein
VGVKDSSGSSPARIRGRILAHVYSDHTRRKILCRARQADVSRADRSAAVGVAIIRAVALLTLLAVVVMTLL